MDVLKQIQYYKMSVVWEEAEDEDSEEDAEGFLPRIQDTKAISDITTEGSEAHAEDDPYSNAYSVSVFPNATGGSWSNDFTTLEEAVAHCLKTNNLPSIE